jgi:quinoprotein dehydrogenase-associated probable ABC transporter substrate-binding protein
VIRVHRLALVLCLVCPGLALGQTAAFRVCADPENMPFSNKALQGFESRIADVLAKDFGTTPSYVWWGQRQGFIRNTMNATLESGRCDIVMGVPVGYDLVRPTQAYYRSSYVFVYPRGKYKLSSLDDPILKRLKIGVHLLGNDYENPPPVHELGKRHIVDNVVGFNTFYSAENPESAIVDAVAAGKIDVAIVWGPPGGYFAARQKVPMDVVPIPSSPGSLPMAFDIAMGVRKGNDTLFARVQQGLTAHRADIDRILKEFSVPVLPRKANPTR